MAVTERRLKQREQQKESILEAARTIMLKEGWTAVSIRKIADVIGYSLPVVYNHFENKDAIMEDFIRHGFILLGDAALAAKAQSADPAQQLKLIAIAYYEFALSHREYYQIMFGLGVPNCDRAKEIAEIGRFGDIIIAALKQLQGGECSPQTTLKFHTFWSILHGLSSINMINLTAAPDELQQKVLQDAIQGFIMNINN